MQLRQCGHSRFSALAIMSRPPESATLPESVLPSEGPAESVTEIATGSATAGTTAEASAHAPEQGSPPDAPHPAQAQKARRGLVRLWYAAGYSWQGLRAGWGEAAFRQEVLVIRDEINPPSWMRYFRDLGGCAGK